MLRIPLLSWHGARVKPRLKRNPLGDEWLCLGGDCVGWGRDEEAAYELWLRRWRMAHRP